MPTPETLYPLVYEWITALGCVPHAAASRAVSALVTALLLSQSLRATPLMRTLPSPSAVPARQRYRRVARHWDRPWLAAAALHAGLIRAALALVAPDPAGSPTAGLTHVVLDSVRLGHWEVFTLGIVWHGRVLPIHWAVLPYPIPRGQQTPRVCRLVREAAAVWPPDRPAHLGADRNFPSRALFETLRQVGWDWTIRLPARYPLRVAVTTTAEPVRERLQTAHPGRWTCWPAQAGPATAAVGGTLVVGRGLTVVPWHQRDPGSQGARQRRRRRYLANQRLAPAARRTPGTPHTPTTVASEQGVPLDQWVALFSSLPTWRAAVAGYRRRYPTEGTYRDAQHGWDGHHGWQLGEMVRQRQTAETADGVLGLWALGTLVQSALGHQLTQPDTPPAVQAVARTWTTSGRLSVWARGQRALTEPHGQLSAWLIATLRRGAATIRQAPPVPADAPVPQRPRVGRPPRSAAPLPAVA